MADSLAGLLGVDALGARRAVISRVVPRRFSVVIPTLQRSHRLAPLVEMYCAHDLVGEVIIVNNAPGPLPFDHAKVRVLQQDHNLYVNQAWNLGVSLAREQLLIISNDDILFEPAVINAAALVLRLPVGIVGPEPGAIGREVGRRIWFLPAYERTRGFGTLMFLRTADFVPIPADMRIWAGDDWLFHHQRRRNLRMKGVCIETEMGTTSGHPEFWNLKYDDLAAYHADHRTEAYEKRYWLDRKTFSLLRRALRR